MSTNLAFWVLMLLYLAFGLWNNWPTSMDKAKDKAKDLGASFLVFVLLAILGWQVFGPALHR
jgi:hypothetical protein